MSREISLTILERIGTTKALSSLSSVLEGAAVEVANFSTPSFSIIWRRRKSRAIVRQLVCECKGRSLGREALRAGKLIKIVKGA